MREMAVWCLAAVAYGCCGMAYITWRGRAVGRNLLSPMHVVQVMDAQAEREADHPCRWLPLPVTVGVAAVAYVLGMGIALAIWPVLALRRAVLAVRGRS